MPAQPPDDDQPAISPDWIEANLPGDPDAIRGLAAELADLAARWDQLRARFRGAYASSDARELILRLTALRQECAEQLEAIQHVRRRTTETLRSGEVRAAALGFFERYRDCVLDYRRAVEDDLRRLRGHTDPLFGHRD